MYIQYTYISYTQTHLHTHTIALHSAINKNKIFRKMDETGDYQAEANKDKERMFFSCFFMYILYISIYLSIHVFLSIIYLSYVYLSI